MRIDVVHAFRDNYVFILSQAGEAVVVDPGDATPVLDFLKKEKLNLSTILITHHHSDHIAGIAKLIQAYAKLKIFSSKEEARVKEATVLLSPGDELLLLEQRVQILDFKGHTRGHIGYYFASGDLFSGDTLFGGCCGNIFEGTVLEMWHTLSRLRALPASTRIWCAHEYTAQYLPDAIRFAPWCQELVQRYETVKDKTTTLPLLLEEEMKTNPYLWWDHPVLVNKYGIKSGFEIFEKILQEMG
ncbi:MAG: hydroxyacylglutathione hydrolase [Oligoflexia bacterium]|nr:hydroxyacylglutathione hydrolase [Oligoflexia bacterium]